MRPRFAKTIAGLSVALLGLAPATGASAAPATTPAALVDPWVGTSAFGNTSPAAASPFGMLQWGPSSEGRPPGDYSPGAPTVGLALTHLSGVGCPASGNVPILPISGPLPTAPSSATASLSGQQAAPGQWNGDVGAVHAQIAVAARAGLASFTFPAGQPAFLLLKTGDSATPVEAASLTFVLGRTP